MQLDPSKYARSKEPGDPPVSWLYTPCPATHFVCENCGVEWRRDELIYYAETDLAALFPCCIRGVACARHGALLFTTGVYLYDEMVLAHWAPSAIRFSGNWDRILSTLS